MSLKVRKAENDFLHGKPLADFYAKMKTVLPKAEVKVDAESIKTLPGEAKFNLAMEPAAYVVFSILTGPMPVAGIFNSIHSGFSNAIRDDATREIANDQIHSLVLKAVHHSGKDMNTQYFNYDLKKDGTTWTLSFGRDWNDGHDYNGWDGITSDPVKFSSLLLSMLNSRVPQAEKAFQNSLAKKNFLEKMKSALPKTEVTFDLTAIKALAGESKYTHEQLPTAFVVLSMLYSPTGASITGILNGIHSAFTNALTDDVMKNAANDAINLLAITVTKREGGPYNCNPFQLDLKREAKVWTLTISRNWHDGIDYHGWDGQTPDIVALSRQIVSLLAVHVAKAETAFLNCAARKTFLERMKTLLPTVETEFDLDSIKSLGGQAKHWIEMYPVPYIVFVTLSGSGNPPVTGLLNSIHSGFTNGIRDDLTKSIAADSMKKLVLHFVQREGSNNGGSYNLELKRDGSTWTVVIGHNWLDGYDYNGFDGAGPDPSVFTQQLLKMLDSKVPKAQKDFLESKSLEIFRTQMKTVLAKTEVSVDVEGIRNLTGESQFWVNKEPTPYVVFTTLGKPNTPQISGVFNGILSGFKNVLTDDFSRNAATDSISKLIVQVVQREGPNNCGSYHIETKKQGNVWHVQVGRNWHDTTDYNGYEGNCPDPTVWQKTILDML